MASVMANVNTVEQSYMTGAVECQVDARGVATVRLNRPEKHNAFDDKMIALLTDCFRFIAAEDNVRALILASNGKSFSAGGDLAWMQRMADYDHAANLADAQKLAEMLYALRTIPQPTIARVQGSAFGGAVGLISCCDIAIAANRSRFALTEVRIGLIPATIAPHVIDAIGPRWARRLFQTGERIDAERAEQIHLIHEACDEEDLDERVELIVGELMKNGPLAMRAAKKLVHDVAASELNESLLADTSERIASIRVSKEGQEGLNSFLQKRTPSWIQGESS